MSRFEERIKKLKKTVDFEIWFVYGKAVFNQNRRCSFRVEHVRW